MTGKNLTIFRKGLLLVGLPIALQLVLLGFLLHLQSDASDADKWAIHTKEVLLQAEESYRVMTETISQTRGAIVTGNADYTAESSRTDARVLPAIDGLAQLVRDNPPQVARVKEFRRNAAELMQRLADQRSLVSEGKLHEAAASVQSPAAQQTIQLLHDELEAIVSDEQTLDVRRVEHLGRVRRQSYWFVEIAAAVTVLVAALVMGAFTRGIGARLAKLADNAARLAERKPITQQVEGRDEIALVDNAFHAAAARLAEAEAVEQQHRAELERRAVDLATANAELARANEDLRYKTQEIETFVYSVSHDLRSPLVNLKGFSKELARSCEELQALAALPGVPGEMSRQMTAVIDGDVRDSVRFIQTAVTRSSNIIDALLRLSRAGMVEYKKERVKVASIVARVVDAMQVSMRERNAQVIVHELPDALADPTAIEQVFGNLIGNAVNYLDDRRPGLIEVGALEPAANGRTVRYYVRDNGLGIPAPYLPKMFVAFQRLHGDRTPGEGIGLALVTRMVQKLGGSVSVESIEGVGSTFFVMFPAADTASQPFANASAAVPAAAGLEKERQLS